MFLKRNLLLEFILKILYLTLTLILKQALYLIIPGSKILGIFQFYIGAFYLMMLNPGSLLILLYLQKYKKPRLSILLGKIYLIGNITSLLTIQCLKEISDLVLPGKYLIKFSLNETPKESIRSFTYLWTA